MLAACQVYFQENPSDVMAKKTIKSSHKTTFSETLLYTPTPANDKALRVAMAYPADHTIALSSLGYMTLFRQLDERPDVAATRFYTDTVSQYRATDFDLIAFSFSFELDVVEILRTLETLGVSPWASERQPDDPLICAGGPVPTSNGEPYADFFDFYLIGEGEDVLDELVDVLPEALGMADRTQQLRFLARTVAGLYAPSLYEVRYDAATLHTTGGIASITPRFDDTPPRVGKRLLGVPASATALAEMKRKTLPKRKTGAGADVIHTPVLTEDTIFANTFLVELMRGCAHRCRFCLASYSVLPASGPPLEPVLAAIDMGLQHTPKIGLLGALIANHPEFPRLCEELQQRMAYRQSHGLDPLVLSGGALRVDTITEAIARTFALGGQRQLTVAIESGSDAVRKRIHKNITHDDILACADAVVAGGIKSLKLYGMIGLPDETEDDVQQTVDLVRTLKKRHKSLALTLGCSTFVPKAATPFQWMPRLSQKALETRFRILQKGLANSAQFRPTTPKWDDFQALLSRGDRRLAPILYTFYKAGGSLTQLKRAYRDHLTQHPHTLPPSTWYTEAAWPQATILPWEAVHLGVDKAILWQESLG